MPPKATQKIRNKSQVRSNPYPNSSQSRSASPLSRELRSLDRSASPLNSSRPGTSSSPVTTTSNHRPLRVAAMENFHRSRLANAQSNARGRGSRGGRGGRGRGGRGGGRGGYKGKDRKREGSFNHGEGSAKKSRDD